MKKKYNERLFDSGLRRWVHLARFKWLNRKCFEYSPSYNLVVELGCFDGKSIQYLPKTPEKYYGFDANWEGGIEMARKNNKYDNFVFSECCSAEEMRFNKDYKASLVISMETLEHIPDDLLYGYLHRISELLNGYFIVTVPNEMGMVFLFKYLIKFLFLDGGILRRKEVEYTMKEAFYAAVCKMGMVERKEHKGFDWRKLQCDMKSYFDIVEVEGVQFPSLPLWLNTQIGFVMKAKNV